MMKFLVSVFMVILCFFALSSICIGQQAEVGDLLNVLKENGTLTQEQYETLSGDLVPDLSDEEDNTADIVVGTEGGLSVATYDGRFSFGLGGRLMLDAAFYDDGETDLGDGTELRRARVELEGTVLSDWEYQFDIDFAAGEADIKDAYISYLMLWPAVFKIGNFKEPLGMENLASSNNIPFMERSLIDEFSPGRSMGIGAEYSSDKWTASAGFFGQEFNDDVDDEGDEGWGVGGRLTIAPVVEETKLIHFGVATNYRKMDDAGEIKFNPGPESHITDLEFADTDDIEDVDHLFTSGVETAGVYGPLSLQGVYINTIVKREDNLQDYTFSGYYVLGSWFITGESRPYKSSNGTFGKIKLRNKAGAVELALRYSAIDLTDNNVSGGKEKNTTVGLNWYINPYVRVMANYIWVNNDENADADGDALGNDDPKIFQTRFQIAL